jgi:uncharacterized repeat protein (TIGR01451 family)
VTKLNPTGSALVYSTYLGGGGSDWGWGVAVDAAGSAYVTGATYSANFPLQSPLQPTYGGEGSDAFVARILAPDADLRLTMTDTPDPAAYLGSLLYRITVTNRGPSAATGVRVTDALPLGVSLRNANPSQGSCSGTSTVVCTIGSLTTDALATVTIDVTPISMGSIANIANVSASEPDSNISNNRATVSTQVLALPP